MTSQLVFVSNKSIETTDVEGYACSQGIIKFFSRNKVFGIHDFLRKVATLKGFVDLTRGDHVNMCDPQTANESHNRGVGISLQGISDIEAMGSLQEFRNLGFNDLLTVYI